MSKRAIETDLEGLNSTVLGGLSHEERYVLYLKAKAEGNEHWQKRLVETIPSTSFRGPDPEYTRRSYVLSKMATQAIYQLHALALKFQLSQSRQHYQEFLELLADDDVDEPVPLPVQEHEKNPIVLFGELYYNYHAYERFAEEIVGVDLETWLVSHEDSGEVIVLVEKLLEVYSAYLDQADDLYEGVTAEDYDSLKAYRPEKLPEKPLDQLALFEFHLLHKVLNDRLGSVMFPPGFFDP